jgi:hypothetical protein
MFVQVYLHLIVMAWGIVGVMVLQIVQEFVGVRL